MSVITFTRTKRSLSLSLIASTHPALYTLPPELILHILSLTTKNTLFALACVSRAIKPYTDALLYAHIALSSHKAIALFLRTFAAQPRTFFAEHVRKFTITCPEASRGLAEAVAACTDLTALTLPSAFLPHFSPEQFKQLGSCTHLTLDTYPSRAPPFVLPALTHLHFTRPSALWYTPLPYADHPRLAHLTLPRRAHANEENDAEFVQAVQCALEAGVKHVVVEMFPPVYRAGVKGVNEGAEACVRASSLWASMQALVEEDPRVALRVGDEL